MAPKKVPSDLEIAQAAELQPIMDIAEKVGLLKEELVPYGWDKAKVSLSVLERLKDCNGIILESNHDVRMLKAGPYPWALKQRVMSRRGHLSNDSVAKFLENDFDGNAAHVILAHLSKQNNLPELALLSAQRALEARSGLSQIQTKIELAAPDEIGKTYRY